jgi:hypothetical protein
MSPNNYKQLLIGGIILGSIIFSSNNLSSYAQELPLKGGDTFGENRDIVIPSPTPSGQVLGGEHEPRGSVLQREMIPQQDQKVEKGIEILNQQEDKGQGMQEELEEDNTGITSSNIIEEEEEEEEQDNDQGNTDVPFVLPFP